MSGYTKGPWKVYGPHFKDQLTTKLQTGDGRVNLGTIDLRGNGLANARLIVAAPELLEALKYLRSFMWTEGYADQTVVMAQADRAIAKAEVQL